MSPAAAFSPDYFTARERFREAALWLGWISEANPIDARGLDGEELTIDAEGKTAASRAVLSR